MAVFRKLDKKDSNQYNKRKHSSMFNIFDPNPDDLYESVQQAAEEAMKNPNRSVVYKLCRITQKDKELMTGCITNLARALYKMKTDALRRLSGGKLTLEHKEVHHYDYPETGNNYQDSSEKTWVYDIYLETKWDPDYE